MNDEKQDPLESKVSQEAQEPEKVPEKEIDLNALFPNETNDLNVLFPDVETRELLKKVSKNKKDIESINQRFEEEIKPTEEES
jgi:hypothetical protein